MPARLLAILKGTVALAGAAALFAWFGVYNTATMPLLPRFGFWLMTMLIGGTVGWLIIPWIRGKFAESWPVPVQILATALIVSVPITIAIMWLSNTPFRAGIIAIQYAYVLIVSVVMVAVGWLWEMLQESQNRPAPADNAADTVAAFLARLPVKYRGADLYAVSAEDHYLRVHTSLGEELILMRLADAMRELEGADGLQTHRSWWVAHDGVADARRADGKLVLALKSGGEAAVSRTYAKAVKAAGLS